MKKFYHLLLLFVLTSISTAFAQTGILDPSDPIVIYDAQNPPTAPNWGQMAKWVKTNRVGFSTTNYKSYIYKGLQFRLRFPKSYQHGVNDGKKYPMIIFFHGIGEKGTDYDNEYQLYHGGQKHDQMLTSGDYDGFLFYPQNNSGYFGAGDYAVIVELINNYFVPQVKLDINRIFVEGLSGGGGSTWEFTIAYPKIVAGAAPISAASLSFGNSVNVYKNIPIWNFQGGVDTNPDPGTSEALYNTIKNAGGNIRRTVYPTLGHGVWNNAWAEPDFFPTAARVNKANPWPLYGRTEFCANETINVTLMLTPGFDGYEWMKDNNVINGANANTYVATGPGVYKSRIKRGTEWSDWSPTPVTITVLTPTPPPTITAPGLVSNVLPTPAGVSSLGMEVPSGFLSYAWKKLPDTATVLGTNRTYTANSAGEYVVKVVDNQGCSNATSAPFKVVNASGSNGPAAASGLTAVPFSESEIRLYWNDQANQSYDETGFEIYRSKTSGSGYELVGIVGTGVTNYTDGALTPNTKYYYIVRAVNNNAAAANSNEAAATTENGTVVPPSAPGNLTSTGATPNSISISWTASTGDAPISKYDIYANGVKLYTVNGDVTSYTLYNLTHQQTYTIKVIARDNRGISSAPSNQVTVAAKASGFTYKYYETAALSKLPNFNTLTPKKVGTSTTLDLNVKDRNDNYAFLWEGYIVIPVSGNYTFETYSDDGSALYFGAYDPNTTPTVNHDGLHGSTYSPATTLNLTAGPHKITVVFFQAGGGSSMRLYWKNTANGVTSRQQIPSSFFNESITISGKPNAPSSLTATAATYKKINLSWNDNSNNETGFEVLRSTGSSGPFTNIYTTAANVHTYSDSSLTASTTYYYRVQAVNNSGTSNYVSKSATTLGLPSPPAAATNLLATAVSTSKIQVNWTDNATNELAYEIYRSQPSNNNYVLIKVLPANATAFTDSLLNANSIHYYKVRARNDGGNGNYSNEDSAKTQNNLPVLTGDLFDRTMRYGTTLELALSATDADGETLQYSSVNLPSFASLADHGDGTATLSLNPASTDQDTYNNIQIKVTDQNNGVTTKSFNLIVNDNYVPSMASISNVTLSENASDVINLGASDTNGSDVLTWSATGLPAFATLNGNGNTATINLNPGFSDAGTYHVTVSVNDGNGGIDQKSFDLTVNDVNPNFKVYVNFCASNGVANAPWNNTAKAPVLNDWFNNLKDDNDVTTTLGLKVLTNWQNIGGGDATNLLGMYTGNNSGVYPDAVIRSAYWTQNAKQTLQLTGANPNYKYTFTFYGSRTSPGGTVSRITKYTVSGQSVNLEAIGNASNTVSIPNVTTSGSTINIDIENTNDQYGYLNAMVIEATYDDGNPPATPRDVVATNVPTGVQLNWTDAAFNETAYYVYRSTAVNGSYVLLNNGATNANTTSYLDQTPLANNTYYYYIQGINGHGNGVPSDTVSILTANKNPVLGNISDLLINTDTVYYIPVTVQDDPGETITLSSTTLPNFVTLVDNGNGSGNLVISAGSTDIGKYTGISLIAKDANGGADTVNFAITVKDKNMTSYYVNFNQVLPAASPWNNFNSLPNANTAISSIKDETGVTSAINVTLLDAFTGANDLGVNTGTNSGVYPDEVLRTCFYEETTTAKRVRISGLSSGLKYNVIFFGSRGSVSDNRTTDYTIGSTTVSLNAASNATNTVQINGVTPDASGYITFTVKRGSGASYAYLSSIVLQSYVDNGLPVAPTGLSGVANSRNSVTIKWTDKSNDEVGFEVYRSTSVVGPYTLITTTAANATTYTDNNLAANTRYYYKVRAKVNGSTFSEYSNIATVSTLIYGVYINLSVDNGAGSPWNNTMILPYVGQQINNPYDDVGNPTGMLITTMRGFTGTNNVGMNTGNNSGIYPDAVMSESYYVDRGDTAVLKLTGLNQSYQYSFTFFGSRDGGGERTTIYEIGNTTVNLQAAYNTQNTVTIHKIVPNSDGEIVIRMYGSPTGQYGYLNALVISASQNDGTGQVQTLNTTFYATKDAIGKLKQKFDQEIEETVIDVTNVYPNPFQRDVYIQLQKKVAEGRVMGVLYDMQGRPVHTQVFGDLGAGSHFLQLSTGQELPSGMYLLRIIVDNKPVKTIKLIKQ